MSRWMVGIVAAFFAVYAITVLATGHPAYLIPVVILAAIVIAFALINRALTRRAVSAHGGDPEALAKDEDIGGFVSPASFPDDATPVGDTPDAHDEINPHDVPKWDRATRMAAEEQAGGEGGFTTGNQDQDGGGGDRFERTSDETTQREGEPQRSADSAKSAGSPG
jgi:hypothetical protein